MCDAENQEEMTREDLEITERLDKKLMLEAAARPTGYNLISKDGKYAFKLQEGVNSIGRMKRANTIALSDRYCSAVHAEILLAEGNASITDIGSTNGTFVNGLRITPGAVRPLMAGDDLVVGHVAFRLEAVNDEQ
jgi:pSer/pThr/pTyr-binding forkhead associated (FHA) protein